MQQLHEACRAGADVNEKFTEDIDPQHAGMTALALASMLNRRKLVEVSVYLIVGTACTVFETQWCRLSVPAWAHSSKPDAVVLAAY